MNIKINPAKVTVKTNIQRIYPKLENLEITPQVDEQNFNGAFGNVKVNGITTENLNITPTTENQKYEGLYGQVNVEAITGDRIIIDPKSEQQNFIGLYENITVNEIQGDNLEITPTTGTQVLNGVYEKVVVKPITGETLDITPSMEQQSYNGVFTKVNVEPIEGEELNVTFATTNPQRWEGLYTSVVVGGDENLVPENIAKDKTIFGVTGTFEGGSPAKITNAQFLFYNGVRVDYVYELLALCEGLTAIGTMFYNCPTITDLDLSFLDTSNVVKQNAMFSTLTNLKTLNLTGWDFGKVEDTMDTSFYKCESLTNVKSFKNYGKGFKEKTTNYYKVNLSYSPLLSHESLIDIITNGLYDLNLTYNVANGGTLYTQSLVLGSSNKSKLTSAEIAIATNKGWSVS